MDYQELWSVIGTLFLWASIGRNSSGCKEHPSILAPHTIPRRMDQRRSQTIALKCTLDVLQATIKRSGIGGYHGQNTATTLLSTVPSRPPPSKLFTDENHHICSHMYQAQPRLKISQTCWNKETWCWSWSNTICIRPNKEWRLILIDTDKSWSFRLATRFAWDCRTTDNTRY